MKYCDVLIIEDDIDDIEILMEELNKTGLEKVHYVYSAKDAFQYLEDIYPDCIPKVIVTDLFLPGLNGVEFIKQLKSQDKYKDVKVVVLSTAISEHHFEIIKELGQLDCFSKPADLAGFGKIADSIRSHIGA
ncbi:MAG: response regulator [Nitrosopumilus sp.]|jgi:CheY-like chemotaxis protein|nr:response regulator [Nitrosopumilus sp.]